MSVRFTAPSRLAWLGHLLVVNGSLIVLLTAAGILGFAGAMALIHLATTFHEVQISSIPVQITANLERFARNEASWQLEAWRNRGPGGADFAAHPAVAALFVRDVQSPVARFVLASGTVEVPIAEKSDWFDLWRQASVGSVSPVVPEAIATVAPARASGSFHVFSRAVDRQPVLVVTEVPDLATRQPEIGIVIAGPALAITVMKLMRQNCTDNCMYLTLSDPLGVELMTVTSLGATTDAAARERAGKELITEERVLAGALGGWRLRVNYLSKPFGLIPQRAAVWLVIILVIAGLTAIGLISSAEWRARASTQELALRNDWVLNLAHTLRGPVHSLGILAESLADPDTPPPNVVRHLRPCCIAS